MATAFNSKFFDRYFAQSTPGKLLANHWLFIFRVDGHLLYSNAPKELSHTYSALLTGAWHSSFALLDEEKGREQDGRLSLELGNKGIIISPLQMTKTALFLGVIFKNVDNPGKIRAHLRLATLELEAISYPKSEMEIAQIDDSRAIPTSSHKDRNGYLFQDISDEEMDSLFNFSGI